MVLFTKIGNIRETINIRVYMFGGGGGGGEGEKERGITCSGLAILSFRYLKWNVK